MAAVVAVWVTTDCKLVILHSGLFMRPHFRLDEMMCGLICTDSVGLKSGLHVHLKKVISTNTIFRKLHREQKDA